MGDSPRHGSWMGARRRGGARALTLSFMIAGGSGAACNGNDGDNQIAAETRSAITISAPVALRPRAPDSVAGDQFGWSLSVSGNTAVISANNSVKGIARVWFATASAPARRERARRERRPPAPTTTIPARRPRAPNPAAAVRSRSPVARPPHATRAATRATHTMARAAPAQVAAVLVTVPARAAAVLVAAARAAVVLVAAARAAAVLVAADPLTQAATSRRMTDAPARPRERCRGRSRPRVSRSWPS